MRKREPMHRQATTILLVIVGVLLGLYTLEPYVRAYVLSASVPRLVEPRGALAEAPTVTSVRRAE